MGVFVSLGLALSALATSFAAPTLGPAPAPASEIEERGDFNFVLGPDSGNPLFRRSNLTLERRSNTNYNQDYITGGTVNYSPGTNKFSVNWNTNQDFVVGVGWNPGSSASITYSGSFAVNSGLGSLSVYGWSTNPLVEYYVMEDNRGISMSGATNKGTITTDGGTYTMYEATRVNQPSIQGTSTFNQYISVRQSARTSGTVTLANHFNAWAAAGMHLGTLNFQVIAVESWSGSGSASQTISNTGAASGSGGSGGGSGGGTGTGTGSGSCAALYGQCGGTGWKGPTCCSSGTCKASNSYYSQCL